MPSVTVKRDLNDAIYFVTMTIFRWYRIFDMPGQWDILTHSLNYCKKQKGLKIYGYDFMLNHIHLIIQAPNVGGFLRDFKSHTAKALIKNLEKTSPNILKKFRYTGSGYNFWQKTNMPIPIFTEKIFQQKLNYIHHNPVRKGYVANPEDWEWSSASYYYAGMQGGIEIDDINN